MKKIKFLSTVIYLIIFSNVSFAEEVEIWFVASVEVGIERFIDSANDYKYWSNRPHYVELTNTYSSKTFKTQGECEAELLSKYVGTKSIVSLRDPDNIGTNDRSTMRFADKKGYVIYPLKDWTTMQIDVMPFYTCAMQKVDLSKFR